VLFCGNINNVAGVFFGKTVGYEKVYVEIFNGVAVKSFQGFFHRRQNNFGEPFSQQTLLLIG
jgi:hypothetical protein